MAAQGSVVARPYAQAVFELARGAGHLQGWSQFLQLAAVLVSEPEFARLLRVPGVDLRRLVAILGDLCREQLEGCVALAGTGPDTGSSLGENFLQVLADNRRLGVLPEIAVRFEALRAEAENTLEVTLTSATGISDEQLGAIEDALRKRFGRQIHLSVELDATLIGGARLQVGDRVIDGSVRTGLDKLATALHA